MLTPMDRLRSSTLRYVPPNVVTCIGMTAGLISIRESITGDFVSAAWFIMLSVLLDKLDGTVARLLKASSRFGMELDSLSDLITFGLAPGILVLAIMTGAGSAEPLATSWPLQTLTYVGCFFYVIASALRLAKFNVLTEDYGKRFFFGLPTTAAGALSCSYFLTIIKYRMPLIFIEVLPLMLLMFGFMMVSRLPLPKLGMRQARWLNVFQGGCVVVSYIFGLIRIFPEFIFGCGMTYLVFGMGWALIKGIRPPVPQAEGTANPAP